MQKGKYILETFARMMLVWHDANARDLPWRGEKDPYRIWVSEIMLQQTRAQTVCGYYLRFLRAFPDLYALANAPEDEVLKMWEGLGYYSRARNLQKAARMVVDEFGGKMPSTRPELMKLPGIGKYVSGAVASIAFGLKEPALDGNQVRVLARVLGIADEIKSPDVLEARAKEIMPTDRPGDYNQALMGLGAMVCLPGSPKCGECPVQSLCRAYASGDPARLPRLPEKKPRVEIAAAVAVLMRVDGRVFVEKRPGRGLLAGLWAFPAFEGAQGDAQTTQLLTEHTRIENVKFIGEIGQHRHIFTHKTWNMTGYLYECENDCVPVCGEFADLPRLEELPFPTAIAPYTGYVKERLESI